MKRTVYLLALGAGLVLTLAGLLEFPADQNFIDGLWSLALRMLNLPPISRSLVRSSASSTPSGTSRSASRCSSSTWGWCWWWVGCGRGTVSARRD